MPLDVCWWDSQGHKVNYLLPCLFVSDYVLLTVWHLISLRFESKVVIINRTQLSVYAVILSLSGLILSYCCFLYFLVCVVTESAVCLCEYRLLINFINLLFISPQRCFLQHPGSSSPWLASSWSSSSLMVSVGLWWDRQTAKDKVNDLLPCLFLDDYVLSIYIRVYLLR